MSTFTNTTKSSEFTPTIQAKDSDTWTNAQHSDIYGAGFNVQTFDSPITNFDTNANTLVTVWTTKTKE